MDMRAAAAVSSSAAAALLPFFRRLHRQSSLILLSSSFWISLSLPNRDYSNSTVKHAKTLTTAPAAVAHPEPPNPRKSWLLVGLGNPGPLFLGTRQNVGSQMLDAIAEAEGISLGSVSFNALHGAGFIKDVPVMLAKPQTFMASSGESVKALVSHYRIPLNHVLVICDSFDLPFGKLCLLPMGGHQGHKGMRSIIHHLDGSHGFPRLRIVIYEIHPGIGKPVGRLRPAAFVLRHFYLQECNELKFTFQVGLEAVRILLVEGLGRRA